MPYEHKAPKLGGYVAHCCLLDLYRIDTEEQLAEVLELDEDERPMAWDTLAEAEAREFERLGWKPATMRTS